MKSARQCALEALSKVSDLKGYSNITLDKILSKNELDSRDTKLATALFYGTLERKITLDYCISVFSKKPPEKMTPVVLNILRMSVYQLLYMDSIPESAAVNEACNLAKANKVTSAAGFVNGVLRSFIRNGSKIPEIKGDDAKKFSIEFSCEEWLCKKLIKQYSKEICADILDTSTGNPPVFIRVNSLKTDEDSLIKAFESYEIDLQKTDVTNCLMLSNGGDLTKTKEFQEGLFHVQDMSSQICAQSLNPTKGDRIADVCSAPGGKAFTMAEIMGDDGLILAMDLHEKRTKLIADGANRLGIKSIDVKAQDASIFNEQLGTFDKVLCDVPCSGFGVIRRKPEIKYKKFEEVKSLPQIQYKILENSSKYVKTGGILIYSTCTLLKEENDDIIEKFLENHSEFEPFDDNYKTTFIPKRNSTDGFFISKIRKIK